MTSTLRILRLLSLLESRRFWTGAELSERLEVSTRTVRRDVDRLRDLGYPVNATAGPEGGYELQPGAVLPPLVLDDDEAVALAVGVRMAALQAVSGVEEASVRALTKLTNVLPDRLRHQVHALGAATVPASWGHDPTRIDPEVLTTLARACRDARRVTFDYTTGDGRQGQRRADPHRLVVLGRRWYLVAFDLDRNDWRSFRVDRAAEVHDAGGAAPGHLPPAGGAAEFVRAGIRSTGPDKLRVTATLHAPAADIEARIGRWVTATPLTDQSCHMEMEVDDPFWAVVALGAAETTATDVRPAEVLAMAHDWGRRLSAASAP